jgi:hypothetical protein
VSYKIRYSFDLKFGDFEIEKDKGPNIGFCDALIVVSIQKPEDGPYSTIMMGKDGTRPNETKELGDIDFFKVWAILAGGLCRSKELAPWQCRVMSDAHEKVKEALLAMRQDESIN